MSLTKLQVDTIKKTVYPNLVESNGPFQYFSQSIYRVQMKDNEGSVKIVYVVQPRRVDMGLKKNLDKMRIIKGMGELADDLGEKLAKIQSKHLGEKRILEERIAELETETDWTTKQKWTFGIAASVLVFGGAFLVWLTARGQYTPAVDIISTIIYGLAVAAITYLFGKFPLPNWGGSAPEAEDVGS